MPDSFAIFALRRKRARLAGEIRSAQNALARQRETLATLDAVIRLFEPETNPELIPAIRPSGRRSLFFKHGEQPRLALAALREADAPMSARQVAEYALSAKGVTAEPKVQAVVIERICVALHALERKGLVRKLIEWPETWWELAEYEK